MRPLESLLDSVAEVKSPRSTRLFSEFLPRGYRATTLSSVPQRLLDEVILTKVRIGTLITLYDDLADNPGYANPELLDELYRLPFLDGELEGMGSEHPMRRVVAGLWRGVLTVLERLPYHESLFDLFRFDVEQFYQANRFSALVGRIPGLNNSLENRDYVSHNMGIVIVGTVDLMASPTFDVSELGRARAFFHRAQEAARLMNVVTTFGREERERDVTGEWVALMNETGITREAAMTRLRTELIAILDGLELEAGRIRTFDASDYLRGMRELYLLHREMEPVI